jgi:hypothetical protein
MSYVDLLVVHHQLSQEGIPLVAYNVWLNYFLFTINNKQNFHQWLNNKKKKAIGIRHHYRLGISIKMF